MSPWVNRKKVQWTYPFVGSGSDFYLAIQNKWGSPMGSTQFIVGFQTLFSPASFNWFAQKMDEQNEGNTVPQHLCCDLIQWFDWCFPNESKDILYSLQLLSLKLQHHLKSHKLTISKDVSIPYRVASQNYDILIGTFCWTVILSIIICMARLFSPFTLVF